ncbi:hypothetical protein ElyMa_004328800 [Elysia marginata]|uniref:Uncharacterized protein n=1 Tax=Elysia marginata TaxID=1093978 RepID=A0AAV4H0R1_9GAST|nr:hypothetical protein ElyMa_004328800 [Elysia marginata]
MMDFFQALSEADAAGIPRQQFLSIWEHQTRLKQMENELRLQQMRIEVGKSQVQHFVKTLATSADGESSSVTNQIEAQLQKFNADQQQVLTALREELQQQNQAQIADISRLLEGFASHVGRVVKGELQTALEGLNLGASGVSSSAKPTNSQPFQTSAASEQRSSRMWSKVHGVPESSESVSSTEAQVSFNGLIQQNDERNESHRWNGIGEKEQMQGQILIQGTNSNVESNKSDDLQETSNGLEAPQLPTFSSLFNGTTEATGTKKEDISPNGYFFPQNGSVDMMVCEMSKVAKTGQISKSPVYYLQDCPFQQAAFCHLAITHPQYTCCEDHED